MNITYTKVEPKYKLGDEFTSDAGNAILTRVSHHTIALVMISGDERGNIWRSGTTVEYVDELTNGEVEATFGSGTCFTQVNPRIPKEPKINMEVTSNELKVLWGRLNPSTKTLESELESYGTLALDHQMKHEMWQDVNKGCEGLGLKNTYNGFKKE